MEYYFLGDTGLKVSKFALGTMSFGGDADRETSSAMFHHCREAGINLFDCADVYNDGRSETILGELIAECRKEVIITSKVYFPTGEDVNFRGASRKHITHAVHDSLRRLKTDYIDIYFLHRFDEFTALEDTLQTLDLLVQQGKVLYPAVSNFAAWQIMKAVGIAALGQLTPIVAVQPMYNLVKRQAEVEILPMAESEKLAVFPYSPLGGGLLTGKYSNDSRPDSCRLTENKMYQTRYGDQVNYIVADRFTSFARDHGYEPASLAVAWVAGHPSVTAPLLGARNLDQLESSLKAVDINMTPDFRKKISKLSPSPPPATDRNEESTAFNYGGR